MKKLAVKTISAVLMTTIVYGAIPGSGSLLPEAKAYSMELNAQEMVKNNAGFITKEVKAFRANLDSGLMDKNEAIIQLTTNLVNADVDVADLDEFVRLNTDEASYNNYKNVVADASKSLEGEQLTPDEFGMVAATAMNAVNDEAVTWTGMGGLAIGIGVTLVVAAVVTTILAIVWSKSTTKIKQQYNDRIRNRQTDHNNYIQWVDNRPVSLQNDIDNVNQEINHNENLIKDYQYDVGVLQGKLSEAIANGNLENAQLYQNQIFAIQENIQRLQNTNSLLRDEIEEIEYEKSLFMDEAYCQGLIDQDYNDMVIDVANYEAELADELQMSPIRQARAKKMWLPAGIAAAVGTFFIIDGATD